MNENNSASQMIVEFKSEKIGGILVLSTNSIGQFIHETHEDITKTLCYHSAIAAQVVGRSRR